MIHNELVEVKNIDANISRMQAIATRKAKERARQLGLSLFVYGWIGKVEVNSRIYYKYKYEIK